MIKYIIKIAYILTLILPQTAFSAVNVAVIAPQSGEYKKFGRELIEGVEIAVNQINKTGGIKGEKINLITVDDRCDDRLSVSSAQMISLHNSQNDKVQFVIGPYCNNSFKEVSEVFGKAGIFQIVPTPVNKADMSVIHKGLIKLTGSQERQAQDFYNFYKSNFADAKVGIVYDSNMRSVMEVASSLKDAFIEDDNISNLGSYNIEHYDDNWDQLATDIKKDKLDIVYVLGAPKDIAKISKSIKEISRKINIVTNRYQQSTAYDKIMGKLVEKTYVIALPSLKDNPAFTETLVKLRLLGVEPRGLSVYGYSAVKLWEEFVYKTDSFSVNKLSRAINNNTIDTGWGEAGFNNGNPANSLNYNVYQIRSGEYTQVY